MKRHVLLFFGVRKGIFLAESDQSLAMGITWSSTGFSALAESIQAIIYGVDTMFFYCYANDSLSGFHC